MGSVVKVTVRCFASVRELLGHETLEVEVPEGTTVEGLKKLLGERAPDLLRLQVAFAVNQDYCTGGQGLCEGDEVAFIPPISGGSGADELFRFELSEEPLDPRSLEREVRSDADGAVVTFAGVTRNENEGRAVRSLSYEVYGEMASRIMVGIFEEAHRRFEITRVRAVHRLGEVPVGETSVLVVVSAPHREPAFEACRFLMDRLKAEVPIFKKELLAEEGESRWVGDLPGTGRED
jgi:molybdopterin synthase catalytic subunit